MPVNVIATIGKAAQELEAEKARIDHQLTVIRGLLSTFNSAKGGSRRAVRRTRTSRGSHLSAAARRAISQRMKAYWAKRKVATKGKGAPRKK